MVVVKKKKGESEDKLIARFKKKVLNSGILQDAREKSRHIKDSEKRKLRKSEKRHRIELEKRRNY